MLFESVTSSDWPTIFEQGSRIFKLNSKVIENLCYGADIALSRKVSADGLLVGAYVLRPGCIADAEEIKRMQLREDLAPYRAKHGVEGVLLVLDPAYRGNGWGKQLMNLPREYGFDYVYGFQTKADHNIHHWLKRRRLVARSGQLFATLQDLR